jgi:DNA polymerase-3 subunit epsilon
VPEPAPVQTSLEEGIPLREVTFVVVDLETTGGSPRDSRITEVGAVRVSGGEREGTFQALVDPGEPIPPYIAHLTGIDDRLVRGEPPIEAVLPPFLEFARGAVFVAHNARFDFTFLNENLTRLDYPPLPGPPVCTAKLARRVVWPDVPNVRLRTLSEYFRTRSRPIHRALDDAMACAEVLDGLLDLAGRLGILTLGDLREAVRARGRPHFGKIALAERLPRAAGVYRFVGRDGRVLYVGKAKDLRTRVKSYFYGDERKQVSDLLGEVRSVEGEETPGGELEALVLEARLIRRHEPKYNRRGKTWRRSAYLKLDPSDAFPRVKLVHRSTPDDGCAYLGPFTGAAGARLAKEALEDVAPLRRCTRSMSAQTRFAPCVLADIGRCPAPCDGRIFPERYGELVRDLLSSLRSPDGLLAALEAKIVRLAEAERFEEAALARDRLRAVASAIQRGRQDAWLVGAGRLELEAAGGRRLTFVGGAGGPGGGGPGPSPPPRPARAPRRALGRSIVARPEPGSARLVRDPARRARGRRSAVGADPPLVPRAGRCPEVGPIGSSRWAPRSSSSRGRCRRRSTTCARDSTD